MFELSLNNLVETVKENKENVLYLIAPNYEPRSVHGVIEFVSNLEPMPSGLTFGLLTLQAGEGRVEPLEELKRKNIETVQTFLTQKRLSPLQEIIYYPDKFSPAEVQTKFDMFADRGSSLFTLILDISALPRRVIFSLMKVIQNYFEQKRLNCVYFLYSWADEYPLSRYPSEVGEFRAIDHGVSLTKRIREMHKAKVALFVGRQGFDAKHLIETLCPDKEVNVYVFVNRNNPLHSFEVMRANAPVITNQSFPVQYYLTLHSGHEKLLKWAEECKIEKGSIYLVAPFGPKPLTISAYLAIKKIRQRSQTSGLGNEDTQSDIVLLSGHQYSSTYSLGYKGASVLKLEASELSRSDS